MVFSSLTFLFVYFPLVCVVMKVAPLYWRNFLLFIVSLIFYGWEEPIYISIMLFSTIFDYINGYMIHRYQNQKRKAKFFLILSIVGNLSILIFFKYFDFIAMQLQALHIPIQPLHLTLPLGISFYTFQTMTYTIDVYKKEIQYQNNLVNFGTYVTMFPQLVAGPIVKYKEIASDLEFPKLTHKDLCCGIELFICGLAKKIILANVAGEIYRNIQQFPSSQMSVLLFWMQMLAFMFQIYFDFSGYSDMAIGLGRMFGFRFPRNFNYPYIARSIKDFWKRWHITLSSFFKEYVYFPLGGSRKSKLLTIRNLFIVWMLTGLWHGAAWNFIFWGLYFGICIILEKFILLKYIESLPKFMQHIYALCFIFIGWIIFSSENLEAISYVMQGLFGFYNYPIWNTLTYFYVRNYLFYWVVFVIASTPLFYNFYQKYNNLWILEILKKTMLLILFLISISALVNDTYNPFLYFRF